MKDYGTRSPCVTFSGALARDMRITAFRRNCKPSCPTPLRTVGSPVHVHVYSNGDVCLNLLGSDWRPSLSISAIAVAILSMLTSAKQKQLPTDNAAHMDVPAGHHGTQFLYHDDKV
nr:ubiquitin-conjugating enzyme, fragment [Toxoplasma gondii RH]